MSWCQTRKNKKQVVGLRMAADALGHIADFALQAAAALFKAKQANSSNNKTMKRKRDNNNNISNSDSNNLSNNTTDNNSINNKPINNKSVNNKHINNKHINNKPINNNRSIKLRSKTIDISKAVKAVKKPKALKKAKIVKKVEEEIEEERLTVEFVDTMYENMWKFVNLDTIKFILKKAGCKTKVTHKDDVWNDDSWTKEFYNSICQKGPDNEGHYVYVNSVGEVLGTYEGQMIDSGDDGICHGAALSAALNDCGHSIGPLKMNPNPEEKATNYRTIMNCYKYIIKQGWWNDAIRTFFYDEVNWLDKDETKTKETNIALKTLNATRF
jgi:hypothetical protein